MPLRDLGLEARHEIQKQKRAIQEKTSKYLDNNSKNAGKLSGRHAPTEAEVMASILESINSACSSGEYCVAETVNKNYIKNIIKYFKSRGYIVAHNSEQIFISWIGGKTWAKNWDKTQKHEDLLKIAMNRLNDFIKGQQESGGGTAIFDSPSGYKMGSSKTYELLYSMFRKMV